MDTIITGSQQTAASTSATNYIVPQGGVLWSATESQEECVIAVAGTLSNLYVNIATAPGGSAEWRYLIRKNEADTALQCTILGSATTGNDTVNTVAVSPGDRISFQSSIEIATPTSTGAISWGFVFTGTTAGESVILAGRASTQAANTTNYYCPQGDIGGSATQGNVACPMPTGGVFSRLYVDLDIAPGVTQTTTVTLYKNGSATTLTAQVSGTNTTQNDTTHSVTYAAGDTISLEVITSLAAAATRFRAGMRWVPTTAGESLGLSSRNVSQAQALTRFRNLSGGISPNATEANVASVMPAAVTIKFLYILAANIASGQTLIATTRKGAANQAVTVTVTGTGTTGNDTSNSFAAVAGNLVDCQFVTSATTGTVNYGTGIVYFIAEVTPFTWQQLSQDPIPDLSPPRYIGY